MSESPCGLCRKPGGAVPYTPVDAKEMLICRDCLHQLTVANWPHSDYRDLWERRHKGLPGPGYEPPFTLSAWIAEFQREADRQGVSVHQVCWNKDRQKLYPFSLADGTPIEPEKAAKPAPENRMARAGRQKVSSK